MSHMKMEDQTFMMVRDAAGNDDPLNDVSMALGASGVKIFSDAADDMMEGSAFR